MEYVAGGDMFEYVVRKGGLKESEARWFFQQLIIGVDYLHRMVRACACPAHAACQLFCRTLHLGACQLCMLLAGHLLCPRTSNCFTACHADSCHLGARGRRSGCRRSMRAAAVLGPIRDEESDGEWEAAQNPK